MSTPANLRGTISVTVHKADDLYDTEMLTKQDPYTIVTIHGDHKKSRVMYDAGTKPVWEQVLGPWTLDGKEDHIDIEVKNKNTVRDEDIGDLQLPLTEAVKYNNQPHWYYLSRKAILRRKQAGTILITVHFQDANAPEPEAPIEASPEPEPAAVEEKQPEPEPAPEPEPEPTPAPEPEAPTPPPKPEKMDIPEPEVVVPPVAAGGVIMTVHTVSTAPQPDPVQCNNGHALQALRPGVVYGHGGFICDKCRNSFRGVGVMHCPTCQYDLCVSCASPPPPSAKAADEQHTDQKCTRGHGLQQLPPGIVYGSGRFSCDQCSTVKDNEAVFHCDVCRYDLCTDCAAPKRAHFQIMDQRHPHALTRFEPGTVYNGAFRCDSCSAHKRSVCFHCGQCNFDLCASCVKAGVR